MVYRVFLPGFPHFVFALVACHFSLKKKNESPRKWNVFFCFFWRVYVCAGKEKRQRDLSIESRSIDGFFGTFVTPGLSRLIEDRRRWAGSSCFSIGQIRKEKTTNPPPPKKKKNGKTSRNGNQKENNETKQKISQRNHHRSTSFFFVLSVAFFFGVLFIVRRPFYRVFFFLLSDFLCLLVAVSVYLLRLPYLRIDKTC